MLRKFSGPVVLLFALFLSGCAKPPERAIEPIAYSPFAATAKATSDRTEAQPVVAIAHAVDTEVVTGSIAGADAGGELAGRVITVRSTGDLTLRPGEVLLTFDDGPNATVTPLVLAALKAAGVKATFFMVGRMAERHPEMVREVALAGHSIGSHTHNHERLTEFSLEDALHFVAAGEDALVKALAPIHRKPAPFFRFPYLAQTGVLRASIREPGRVIFGIDVDSRDFDQDTPEMVMTRTLERLDARGGGIVLFHDIHMRTAKMLPDFLKALNARGYRVVHAVPGRTGIYDREILTALQSRPPALTTQ